MTFLLLICLLFYYCFDILTIGQLSDRVSVTQLLPSFASSLQRSLKTDKLHLVQGLDRDVSGAIILAK